MKYAEIYDNSGEEVAHFSRGGWSIMPTKAEAARQKKMYTIYNEAYAEARKAKKTEPRIFVENFSGIEIQIENTFDKKA